MSVTILININTADKELKQIPGVGERVARLLIQFREVYSVIKKEALNLALRDKLPDEALDKIDFSVPRQQDPFQIDLSCLSAVPKTNSWHPLVSFAHQTAARQSRNQVGENFAMSTSYFAEQESSPKLAGASSMHKSCRTDSRPASHSDEEDAKSSVSKTSSSKSANHSSRKSDSEVEKKNRTASGSRSQSSQRHSRTSKGGMGSCRSKSPKAQSSSSRSRSPSSRRHLRKHSPTSTHYDRRQSKVSSSVSRSRSHSRSVSRSRSVECHSRKFVKKVSKKKNTIL